VPSKVLILTEANDIHAMAVAEALERKGAEVTCWATSDFPIHSDESVRYCTDGTKSIRIRGADLDLVNPAFDVVWRRRPAYVLDRDVLHPADRSFADSECGMFRRSLLRLIAPGAFWVNPPEGAALAASKILQQEAAMKIGLAMPETLFTNSPEEIRQFLQGRRTVIYKPLSGGGWTTKDREFLTYTAILTEEDLIEDRVLRQTPGIFQELVPKAYELRVTVIGHRVFAAKVLSQQTEKGKLDWRRSYDELQFEQTRLPPEIEDECRALLGALGLVFGCFDFIVTPNGDHVFLEVNEMGQFLFIERCCGLPLLDAFSEFLLQARMDFDWDTDRAHLRYTDPEFEQAALARSDTFQASHCPVPESLADDEE
jgi:glutathione synthase/RimK-type ligase-like ATP-grasp enzyme